MSFEGLPFWLRFDCSIEIATNVPYIVTASTELWYPIILYLNLEHGTYVYATYASLNNYFPAICRSLTFEKYQGE